MKDRTWLSAPVHAVFAILLLSGAVHAQPAPNGQKGVSGPDFSKIFTPDIIGPGSVSTLRFDIVNFDPFAVADLAFTDTLPAGVTIADPANAFTDCLNGVVSAPDGGVTIGFSNGDLGASQSCFVSVDVTSSTPATHTNMSGALTSSAGTGDVAMDDLTVTTTLPGFFKSFAPGTVPLGNRSTLTLTIDNTANALEVPSLDFTDNLPVGMVVAGPANASTDCVGGLDDTTLIAAPGTSVITLDANGTTIGMGFEVLPPMGTCTVTVDVIATAAGMLDNVSEELLADFVSAGKASATLDVTVTQVALRKDFTDDPVPPGGTVSLEFTIDNFDRDFSATNIAFTDDLTFTPSVMLAATGLPQMDVCGTGSMLSGTTFLSLTGGSLPPEGACTFSVTLQVPGGESTGAFTNTTSAISADVDGSPVVGNVASETLYVETAPVLTKEFLDAMTLASDPVVGAGDDVVIRFTVTNTNTEFNATNIQFMDELTDGLNGGFLPFPVTVALPPVPDPPCGLGSSFTLVSCGTDCQALSLTGGSVLQAGMMGDSCSFEVTLTLPVGLATNTYVNTTGPISADLNDAGSFTGSGASDTLDVVAAPTLNKEFTDDPVLPGDTVTLEFTLTHDVDAPGDASGITFTDDLTTAFAGLAASAGELPLADACGPGNGTVTGMAGDTFLTFSGATLMPGEVCTFSLTLDVPGTAPPGDSTNSTSDVSATILGAAATENGASGDIKIAALTLTKAFTDDPVIPGDTVDLQFTIANVSPTDDATNITFQDDLDNTLSGMTAQPGSIPATPCGAGSTLLSLSGNTLLFLTGGNLLAGEMCTFTVTLDVPLGAADGTYPNIATAFSATVGGSSVAFDNALDELVVDSSLLSLTKEFTDDPVTPGGTVNLRFTLTNLDPAQAASAIAFTDDLGNALAGLVPTGLPVGGCGGTASLTMTDTIDFSGGSLAGDASCFFDVTVSVPAAVPLGTVATNTTSGVTGMIGGLGVTGVAASDDLRIDFLTFTKAFDGPTTAGGAPVLTFSITNLDATAGVNDVGFTDNLSLVIPGLVATGLPVAACGGTVSGTGTISLSGGSLGPAGSCTIPVTLSVPGTATAGTFANTTSDLSLAGLPAAAPATDSLTVEPPPLFAKAFAPAFIGLGGTSTLSFSIDNSASAVAATGLDFTDNLPAGVEVAAVPGTSNTCGGALTATAGTTTISLSGGSVGAMVSCLIQVDVTGTAVGALLNTSGDLTSSSGNSGPASDTLTVNPQPGFAKSFAPDPILVGGASTLTFTIDNGGSSVNATSLAFSDSLPAGLQVAVPANAGTTCTGGTLTAVSGTALISYGGGTATAGTMCTVSVDVTGTLAGTFVNMSGALTSSLGSSGGASDSLTVNAPPGFGKAFAPNPIVAGAVSTLTFTIGNTASTVDATGLDFTDNLPAPVTIGTPANAGTTCSGGTLTAPDGGGTIGYTGGTVAAGASCMVSVEVTSATPGSHANLSGDLTSSLGNSGTAGDTLIVNAGPVPTFAKSFVPDPIVQGANSTLTFSINNAGSLVDADNLDFSDTLPAGMVIATPSNATTDCSGGTLTAPDGGGTIGYTGGSLAAGASCTLTVDVTAQAAGSLANTSGDLTSTLGNSGPASDTLTVTAASVPGFIKAFAPGSIGFGGISTLTFTIDNSGSLADATGLDFTDNLPVAVTLATPANASTDCTGGTLTAPDGGGTVSYGGGSVAAGATCTVSADVTSMTAGSHVNTSGDLTSSLGNSGPASDTLDVAGNDLTLTKAFLTDPVLPGGTVDVEFTIANVSASFDASGITFMDDLNGAIPGMSAVGLPLSACGGTLSGANGDTELTFAGGTLTAGTSCVIAVSLVVPASAAPGSYTNTTGPISGTFAGMAKGGPVPGAPASATFTVAFLSFSKAFAGGATVGGIATLNFIISNPDPANTATAIGFSDDLNAFIPGAAAIMLPQNDLCGAGSSLTGTSVITLAGGTLGPGALCTFQVRIQIPDSIASGAYTNVTGALAATVGGAPVTGAGAVTATAVLGVGAVTPVPSLSTWGLLALIGLLLLVSGRRLRALR